MIDLIRNILGKKSYPLNKILISEQNLIKNYKYLSSLNPKVKVAPVLKSNAYGHGIEVVGKILEAQKPPLLCVDSLFEAYQLKKAGVKTPILIMGYIDPKSLMAKNLPFHFAVFDLEQAQILNKFQKGAKIHIFVDTGMNREGVKIKDLPELIKKLKSLKYLKISGLMSHLACSDKPNSTKTKTQIKNFKQAKQILQHFSLTTRPEVGGAPRWFHLGGSLALINELSKDCNLIRAGRAIYGLGSDPLKPALELKSKIIQIKKVKKGETIGYSESFKAKKDMTIAILPIGYNDGVDRRLSNKGVIQVGGVDCKIIGLISMNVTTIDISGVSEPFLGQEVTIFSSNPTDKNSIENSDQICNTIPHELLIHLNPTSIRREIIP